MRTLSGINVIGYASGNLGLGVVAREFSRLLLHRGHPLAIFDLTADGGRSGIDLSLQHHFVSHLEDLPHSINLWIVGATQIESIALDLCRCDHMRRKLNAAFVWWELPSIPPAWRVAAMAFDVIVTGSEFVREAWANATGRTPVLMARHPLTLPEGIRPDRQRFGLPTSPLLFFTGFEPASDPQRKNPFAAIEAFQRAFVDKTDVRLVVKLNNPGSDPKAQESMRRLYSMIERDDRVICLQRRLSYADLLSLYASCDVVVSLHRAEGLGLMPLEAMRLGKAVISTGWSGNMTYMGQDSAALVDYDLIPTDETSMRYAPSELGIESFWAEPDVAHAAAWMKALAASQELRQKLGARALQVSEDYNDRAMRADFALELGALAEQHGLAEAKNYQAISRALGEVERERRYRRMAPLHQWWARAHDRLRAQAEKHLLWRWPSV